MNNQNAAPGWGPPPSHGPPPARPSASRRLLLVLVAVVVTLGVTAAVGFAFSSGDADDSGTGALFADLGGTTAPSSRPGSAPTSAPAPSSSPAPTQTAVTDQDEERLRSLCAALQKVGAPYVPDGSIQDSGGPHDEGNRIDAQCELRTDGQPAVAGYLTVEASTFAPLVNSPSPDQACRSRLTGINAGNPLPAVASGSDPTYAGVIERIVRMGTVYLCAGDLLLNLQYSLTRYQPSPARPVLADAQLLDRTRAITTALASTLG